VKWRRFGAGDQAVVDGEGVLAWVNWKSAVMASIGQENKRKGRRAEWPVLDCKDGYAAFVFNERDWPNVVEMVDDPILRLEKYATFEGRQADRDGYMGAVRAWFRGRTKQELAEALVRRAIPGAPAATLTDLLSDPLMTHRATFERSPKGAMIPRPPHRVAREQDAPPTSAAPARSGGDLPLSGLRVLDFGIITAGAGVSALLADLGADVLKVESRERFDPFRAWPGAVTAGESPVFKSNNRNKRGIAIDLKAPGGVETFLELAQSSDIVLENYRRGVLDRLGLTFDALRAANPRIVLASISSQGLDGPGSTHTTFGSTLEASSGFASLTCYADGRPVISGRNLNYPDQIVCLYGAAIVAAAAVDCQARGVARHIDVSQRDCAVYQLGDVIAAVSHGAADDADTVRGLSFRPALSRIFPCADGEYAALSGMDAGIAGTISGLASLAPDAVAAWAAERTADEAAEAFVQAGGGGVRARKGDDLVNDPGYLAGEIFSRRPNGALVKGFPFQFARSPMRIWGDSPAVGEHTEEV
ncbi:MAG: CoA transferase, partial [Caulobacterales bacterium]|nr:CoA transferase [Caulobacterales bacterium]